MPVSQYPNGFENGLVLKGVPVEIPHPGKVFWVNNSTVLPDLGIGGSNGNPGSYLKPFLTVDYAIGKCKANRGDVIYVMPGHVEDITAAQGVDFDVAGVKCIGLGYGDKQARFDMTALAGDVTIDADNVHIYNMNFHANVTSITIGLSILTLAVGTVIKGCTFDVETTTTDEFLIAINLGVGCDRTVIEGCLIDMGLGGAAVGIKLVGASNKVDIKDCRIVGDYSLANIDGITTLSKEVYIEDNFLMNGGSADIGTVAAIILLTGTTGVIRRNHIVCNLATPDLSVVADTMMMFDNLYSETITGSAEPLYPDKVPDHAANFIGVDDADNLASTSNVVANENGSILERLEQIQEAVNIGSGTSLAANKSLVDALGTDGTTTTDSAVGLVGIIGSNTGTTAFSSSSVVADLNGNVLERLEALMDPLGGYDPVLGFRVTKQGDNSSASGLDALFTVTGRCLITHLSGEVTTQIGTTTTLKITDVTNSIDLCAATTITGDVVGTMYHLDGVKAAVLNSGIAPVVGSTSLANGGYQPIIVGGTQAAITLQSTGDQVGTGIINWVLYYKPLVASATVVAAA